MCKLSGLRHQNSLVYSDNFSIHEETLLANSMDERSLSGLKSDISLESFTLSNMHISVQVFHSSQPLYWWHLMIKRVLLITVSMPICCTPWDKKCGSSNTKVALRAASCICCNVQAYSALRAMESGRLASSNSICLIS